MYNILIPLLTFVLPAGSVIAEALSAPEPDIVWLIGKWFTFWGIGVRLLLAGLNQVLRPEMTSRDILGLSGSSDINILVQELGFANSAIGLIGIASLFAHAWLVPAAVAGGVFLGAAGIRHLMKDERNLKENIAMVTDIIVFLAVAIFLIFRAA